MGSVWELDFYSRPILDDNQKKQWEVLICNGAQSIAEEGPNLRYSKFLSNQQVNSIELRDALQEAIDQVGESPLRIRFFRYQMQNMIKRACDELGLPARLSRRTLTLQSWLDDRQKNFYPEQPGYQASTSASTIQPLEMARPLPDALMGQRWAMVSLPAKGLADMPEWDIGFGEAFPLELASISPDTLVPGILIFSERALPLAAWMSGLELAYLDVQLGQISQLLLETGSNDTWIMASLNRPELKQEAERFMAAKEQANQVHFVAVQDNPDSESFAGFWLMQKRTFG
ncbi:Tab2/Atab2 family RNA-binding protein [Leptothoe sp. PORK10 BA2]|uniref:Tab2/Atab2 family RNA-binding protein n=1 Tax=Leptothoe sp. PORK10 BA2 TaxID=3110254 RepID=UPI002B1F63A4|nr:Tab2/Atab2 family RNA-binding protein [Leptothoe sp. PORK10 BA2]MEA5466357.1 Tab2/Atab2 family RNA-binding protein [Leptothoe sp. PORK10 BA2]